MQTVGIVYFCFWCESKKVLKINKIQSVSFDHFVRAWKVENSKFKRNQSLNVPVWIVYCHKWCLQFSFYHFMVFTKQICHPFYIYLIESVLGMAVHTLCITCLFWKHFIIRCAFIAVCPQIVSNRSTSNKMLITKKWFEDILCDRKT